MFSCPLLYLADILQSDPCTGLLKIYTAETLVVHIWIIDNRFAGCLASHTDLIDEIVSQNIITQGKADTAKGFYDKHMAAGNRECLLDYLISTLSAITEEQRQEIFSQQVIDASEFILSGTDVEFEPLEELPYSNLTGLTISLDEILLSSLRTTSPALQKEKLGDFIPSSINSLTVVATQANSTYLNDLELLILEYSNSETNIKDLYKRTIAAYRGKESTSRRIFKLICSRLVILGYVKVSFPSSAMDESLVGKFLPNTDSLEINYNPKRIYAYGFGIFSTLWAANFFGFFGGLNYSYYDQLVKLKSGWQKSPSQVALITVSDEDINLLEEYPITDNTMAQALSNIQNASPKAIGLDIYRDIPVGEGIDELNQVFRKGNIYGVEKIVQPRSAPSKTLAEIDRVGTSDLVIDPDGFVRRYLLSTFNQSSLSYSLAQKMALDYLLEEYDIEPKTVGNAVGIGKARFQELTSYSGFYRGIDPGGFQVMAPLFYKVGDFDSISFYDLYTGNIDPARLRDKFVLVGSVADSTKDIFNTPLSRKSFGIVNDYGLNVHANMLEAIMAQVLEGTKPIRAVAYYQDVLILLLSFGGGIGVGLLLLKFELADSLPFSFKSFVIASLAAGTLGTLLMGLLAFQFLSLVFSFLWSPLLFNVGLLYAVAQLRELTKKIQFTDPVLSCGNSGYFTLKLESKLNEPASLGVMAFSFPDYDDSVLRTLVEYLSSMTSSSTYEVYRYRKSCFCIITTVSQQQAIEARAEKISLQLSSLTLQNVGEVRVETHSISARQESSTSILKSINNFLATSSRKL